MLVLLGIQRINTQRALAENPVFRRLNSDQRRHGKLVARSLAVDDAGFHYEGNFFERGDVVERIAGDGDDVCLIAGF